MRQELRYDGGSIGRMSIDAGEVGAASEIAELVRVMDSCGLDPQRFIAVPMKFTFAIETQFDAIYGFQAVIRSAKEQQSPFSVYMVSESACDPGDQSIYRIAANSVDPALAVTARRWLIVRSISPSNPNGDIDWGIQAEIFANNREAPVLDVSGPGFCEINSPGGSVDVVIAGDCVD